MKNLCLFIVALFPLFAQGQTLFDTNQRLTVQSGIDPSLLITFRYERRLEKVFVQKDLYPFAEVSSSPTRFGFKNSELKIGNKLLLWRYQHLGVITGIGASFGSVETLNFDSKKIAADADVAFGHFGSKGFLALTAAYERILVNQLTHSHYYLDRFYDEAENGWYKGSGGFFQFGIEGGVIIRQMVDVYTDIKIPTTEKFNGLMGSPGHVNIGVGYRF